jgi:hypothetical protein
MQGTTVRNIVIILIAFLAICSGCIYITTQYYDNRIGQLNIELGRSRENYRQLELEYRAIEQSNRIIGERLNSIQRGITEAKDITESISGKGKTATEQVRIIIENLKKIRKILADIGNI